MPGGGGEPGGVVDQQDGGGQTVRLHVPVQDVREELFRGEAGGQVEAVEFLDQGVAQPGGGEFALGEHGAGAGLVVAGQGPLEGGGRGGREPLVEQLVEFVARQFSFEDPHHLDQYALAARHVQCRARQQHHVLAQLDTAQVDLTPQQVSQDDTEVQPPLRVLHAAQAAQCVGQPQQQP